MSILFPATLGNRLAVLRGVHDKSCLAPDKPCSCSAEQQQYYTTGSLSILGGVGEFIIGRLFSMLALTASFHSGVDGIADVYGGRIAKKAREDPANAGSIRRKGNHIIAFLMAAGAVWILYDASDRLFFEGLHFVAPLWIMLAGLGKGSIDTLRILILLNAQRSNPNETVESLLLHAISDFIHSGVASIVGGVMWVSELAATDIQRILQWIDLGSSLLLAGYMMYLSKLIWQGRHHGHYLLHLVYRLRGKKLSHH